MENGHVRSDHRDNEEGEMAVTAPLVSDKRKPIRLSSPGGANSMTFYFNQSCSSTHHLIALDILEIIKYASLSVYLLKYQLLELRWLYIWTLTRRYRIIVKSRTSMFTSN